MKQRIFYHEVNSIRKGFQPQTLLITDKEGNRVSSKEEVLQMWFEYYEKRFILQDGTVAVEKCGQSAYKPQNHITFKCDIPVVFYE